MLKLFGVLLNQLISLTRCRGAFAPKIMGQKKIPGGCPVPKVWSVITSSSLEWRKFPFVEGIVGILVYIAIDWQNSIWLVMTQISA